MPPLIYALSLDGSTFRYVGLTRHTVEERLRVHRKRASTTAPPTMPVHKWMRKHEPKSVQVTVLCYTTLEDLGNAERWWIAELRDLGYDLLNCTDGGDIGAPGTHKITKPRLRGYKTGPMSEEHKEKIRAASRGKPKSDEHKEKIRQAAKGRAISDETRQKLSDALSGRKPWNKDKQHSDETRAKMSKAHQGKKHTPEAIEKTAAAHRGRKRSPETRARISAARKASAERKRLTGLS
jgi:hypothetical protein